MIFTYWTGSVSSAEGKAARTTPGAEAWQHVYPDFTVFTDAEVLPLLPHFDPELPDLFRRIRIPACRSDIARLVLLHHVGGLYLDAHVGPGDGHALARIMGALAEAEAVLFDAALDPQRPHDFQLMNGVICARKSSPVIELLLKSAINNLRRHDRQERASDAYVPYNIFALTGAWDMTTCLFDRAFEPPRLRDAFKDSVRIVRLFGHQETEPFHLYHFYGYRSPGQHWSERQKVERLFETTVPSPGERQSLPCEVAVRNAPRLIARTRDSEVFHLPGDSAYCVITFSEHDMRANGRDFWGQSVFANLGTEAIGVVGRRPHWFHAADFLDYAETIRKITRASGKPLIGYGYSMGAYAAIKYAARLDLDLVLSYAPLWSISPADLGEFRSAWSADFDPALHSDMAITQEDIGPKARLIIFADPCDPQERFHINRIAAMAAHFNLIPVRHAGHYILRAVAGRDLFQTILNLCLEANVDFKRDLSVLCNRAKRRSEYYWYVLGGQLIATNHRKWYAQVIEHAVARWPASVALLLHLGRLRSMQGDYARMSDAMARAAALEPHNPHVYGWWGALARDLGYPAEALGHFKRAYSMAPQLTHLEAWIAELSCEGEKTCPARASVK